MARLQPTLRIVQLRYTADDYRSRPKDYDPRLADMIVEMTRQGETLPAICADGDMPLPGTFLLWCRDEPELEARWVEARKHGTDLHHDEMMEYGLSGAPDAPVKVAALKTHVEREWPEKYGTRSLVRVSQPTEQDLAGGIDYSAELRRKLDLMAERQALAREAEAGGPEETGS